MTNSRTQVSWLVVSLGILCAGAILAAALLVGPASSSQATVTRTATVARSVVQSTVSGSGSLAPISQLDLGFKTGGTVTDIYSHVGEQVAQGQLLATLDPESAELTVEQARAALQSDEAQLARDEEETDASAAPAAQAPAASSSAGRAGAHGTSSSSPASAGSGSATSTQSSAVSAATRQATLASARAALKSQRLTVQDDEQAVQDTKLYAPESGTIVALSGQVGEVLSASGTTRVAPSASASSASSSTAGTAAAGSGAATRTGASAAAGSSSASSTSSSPFAILSNLSAMQLVVPLSESEVGSVRPGQIATVTVEALEGRKLAARVSEVAILSTSNGGVVSYDVTFQLDQLTAGLKPGMSATAEVVVKQAEGLNVPTSAISAGTVTVLRDGKRVRQPVVTGLAGDSSTIVLSGLSDGETVLLPSVTSTSSTTGATSGARRLGGLGGLGGAGGALFRGGG